MRPLGVVVIQAGAEVPPRVPHAVVGPGVNLFVFQVPPEALDEDVVAPRALPGHADADTGRLQHAGEGVRGELGAWVRVEDSRCPAAHQRLGAEA